MAVSGVVDRSCHIGPVLGDLEYRSDTLCMFLDSIQEKSSATEGCVGCGWSVVISECGSSVEGSRECMSWRSPSSAKEIRLSAQL